MGRLPCCAKVSLWRRLMQRCPTMPWCARLPAAAVLVAWMALAGMVADARSQTQMY